MAGDKRGLVSMKIPFCPEYRGTIYIVIILVFASLDTQNSLILPKRTVPFISPLYIRRRFMETTGRY